MVCPHPPLTLDLETVSKVANRPSKFGHARPSHSRIIHYVRNKRTDRQTDKSNAYCPFPTVGRIITIKCTERFSQLLVALSRNLAVLIPQELIDTVGDDVARCKRRPRHHRRQQRRRRLVGARQCWRALHR